MTTQTPLDPDRLRTVFRLLGLNITIPPEGLPGHGVDAYAAIADFYGLPIPEEGFYLGQPRWFQYADLVLRWAMLEGDEPQLIRDRLHEAGWTIRHEENE